MPFFNSFSTSYSINFSLAFYLLFSIAFALSAFTLFNFSFHDLFLSNDSLTATISWNSVYDSSGSASSTVFVLFLFTTFILRSLGTFGAFFVSTVSIEPL